MVWYCFYDFSVSIWNTQLQACFLRENYTVVCSVPWPLNRSEAGSGLVWLSFSCANCGILMLTSQWTWSFTYEKQEGLWQNKVTAIVASNQWLGHWAHNCKIAYCWMRLNMIWGIMEMEEGLIRQGRSPRQIGIICQIIWKAIIGFFWCVKPSPISIILQIKTTCSNYCYM